MIATLRSRFAPLAERARQVLPVVLTLALFLLLLTALASTYVGHSRSPYDTCYGPNGRAVSCALLESARERSVSGAEPPLPRPPDLQQPGERGEAPR